jgi:superfamily II DNA or RNA helicase
LKDGREWNFKATQFELPDVVDAMRKSFDTYWCDDNFEQFVPGVDDDRLKKALDKNHVDDNLLDFSLFDLMRAKDYQLAILERLETEREVHGRYRNLIVAATGTGKTVISAYDFKRYYEKHPDCRFLFIAHRQEILRQSLQTYRYILEDQNFGELMYSGHKPNNYRHMFASKDMLINRLDETILTPDYYDYIVVDEVHHIVAATYVKLMNYFKPKILIGLTATPERMNASEDITVFFDGHISAEIRLPDALNAGILAPFEYYGIPDGTDLSEIKWTAGGYDPVELTKIYTTNDLRTKLILNKVQEYIGGDIHTAKALCFCVNKEHARYMNAKFTLAGLHSDVLTSDDSESHRKEVRSKLKHGNINYLFVVDIFNEGVDIPEIDLILFLRPTESLTVFLQQFGRGLRKSEGKTHLTVLDFVGHARAEFNYKERFEALIGRKTLGIKKEIEYGFPNAPFNCKITLEPKAREEILENITGFLGRMRSNRIVAEIKTFYESNKSTFSLKTFVEHSNIPLHRIYKSMTWGRACVEAGVTTEVSGFDSAIAYAVKNKWLATDSYSYFSQLLKFAESGFKCDVSEFSELETRYATMLYYDMYEHEGAFASMQQMFNAFASDRLLINELCDMLSLLRNRCNALEKPDNSVYAAHNPLKLHGVYTKAQIQAALGFSTFEKCSTAIKDGVERRRDIKLEAMYVNIIKKENTSASTNYQDFALSRSKFHWETQNKVSDTCPTAQSYRTRENHMLLFVRQQHTDPELKVTMAYTYLGEVDLERMEGSRPVKIVWNLRTPMSESTFAFASMYKAIG